MIEKDMEDLIASFPDDFFPRKHFVLIGRQQSFSGIGRFDLLFEDEFKSTILMELKARTLKYDDATQVARYRDELKRTGCQNIVMWLVAPQIPTSVREFLDDKGIEYTEIHVPEFRRVAERHSFVIQSESPATEQPAVPAASVGRVGSLSRPEPRSHGNMVSTIPNVPTGAVVTSPSPLHWKAIGHDLALENPENFDPKKFLGLVDTFASVVRSGKNKSLIEDLKRWAENPRYSRLTSTTVESLLRWTTTGATTWKASVPYAYEVWAYLFGTPAPTWKNWNHGEGRYEFDAEGWRKWFESLSASSACQ
jgi:Endonuclease NucS